MNRKTMVKWMSILCMGFVHTSCCCEGDQQIQSESKAPLDWFFVSTEPVVHLYNAYRLEIELPTKGLFPASVAVTRVESEIIDESINLMRPLIFTNPSNEFLKWNSTFDDLMAISEVFPITQFDMGGEDAHVENVLGAFHALDAKLGLIYAVNEFDDLETEIIGSLYDTQNIKPIAHIQAHAVSIIPTEEELKDNSQIDLWDMDSTAIARERFEALVYACIRELIEHDEPSIPDVPPGWKPVGPVRRVKWPPLLAHVEND